MPLVRYVLFVGAALIALLFISDAYLPKPPDVIASVAPSDLSIIRIRSDRKLPDRIVFDTSIPTIVPAQTALAQASVPTSPKVAELSGNAGTRGAFAQLTPTDLKASGPKASSVVKTAELKRPDRRLPRRRRIARKRVGPPTMLVAQQPQFGFFTNSIW
jgi:hypothetical protein